jgi:hypothetical protein
MAGDGAAFGLCPGEERIYAAQMQSMLIDLGVSEDGGQKDTKTGVVGGQQREPEQGRGQKGASSKDLQLLAPRQEPVVNGNQTGAATRQADASDAQTLVSFDFQAARETARGLDVFAGLKVPSHGETFGDKMINDF